MKSEEATDRKARGRLAVVLFLLGFGSALADSSVLRVGTSDDYPPFSSHGRGFDIDVARAMARDFGMRLEWVRFRWPDLGAKLSSNAFDIAMSGVTWRPDRAVVGWMTRAVAQGGPCVVGDPSAGPIAVNRGGFLESWARRRFDRGSLLPVDDNLSLRALLEGGAVAAFVSDSFEVAARRPPADTPVRCAPPRDRKVYWVAPAYAAAFGPRVDAWLAANEPAVDELRRRWLGGSAPRDRIDDVVDLLARRFELMPAVAAWKRAHGRPIEDPEREQQVLRGAEERARSLGLDAGSVRRLTVLEIDLAKALQRRSIDSSALDLNTELRPALSSIDERILDGLAEAAPIPGPSFGEDRLLPLGALLKGDEIERLRAAILDVNKERR